MMQMHHDAAGWFSHPASMRSAAHPRRGRSCITSSCRTPDLAVFWRDLARNGGVGMREHQAAAWTRGAEYMKTVTAALVLGLGMALCMPAMASRPDCTQWVRQGTHYQFRNSCSNADVHYRYCVIGSKGGCNHSRGYWGGTKLNVGQTAPGPHVDCAIEVFEVNAKYSNDKITDEFHRLRSANCP